MGKLRMYRFFRWFAEFSYAIAYSTCRNQSSANNLRDEAAYWKQEEELLDVQQRTMR